MRRMLFVFGFMYTCTGWGLSEAQTVQLPSFDHFDASTTIWVPDGGSTNTAGISRASSGGSYHGTPVLPFGNRSYGSDVSTGSMQTSVQIIDQHEMDAAILNSPSPARVRRAGDPLQPPDFFQMRPSAVNFGSGGFLSARESIQSRIQLQKNTPKTENKNSESDPLHQPMNLGQDADAESSAPSDVQAPASDSAQPTALTADLNLSPSTRPIRVSSTPPELTLESTQELTSEPTSRSTLEPTSESNLDHQAALALAKKGYAAEKAGKRTLALSLYSQALELADGKLKSKIQKRYTALLDQNEN